MIEADIISPNYPVKNKIIFKGDKGNPFLAPRGVFISGDKLIVSDTGQNRVFIWNKIPRSEHQSPDVVLGQDVITGTERNNGKKTTASSLQYPSGLWSDGEKLIVADAWNHRVLVWNTFPTRNGQLADVVIGQPDFESNQPNLTGVGKVPSAQSLYWCYGVWVHEKSLFIADTGNRRVLMYNSIPKENFAPADAVFGGKNFTEKDYEPEQAVWPYSVKISEKGEVLITDTQYFRVLYWPSVEKALMVPAEKIFGQSDLKSNGQNQFALKPSADSLSWCYDSHFYKDGLWVADTGNSRLLYFENIPEGNAPQANALIGHTDFNTGSENADTVRTTENSLYWPFAISIHKQTMAVADTGNHRITIYSL